MIRASSASGWANRKSAGFVPLFGKYGIDRMRILSAFVRLCGLCLAPAAIFCAIALAGAFSSASAQSVSLSPASVIFVNQAIGTSSTGRPVTLTNTGTATLSVVISISGDYSETDTCGGSVGAGAKCTITVTFTPQATGSRSGTLTFSDNASNSPQTVGLSGTGVVAVGLAPSSVTFGAQFIGVTSAAKATLLTNNQSIALPIASIVSSGDFAQTNNCGASLGPSSKCTINVTFTPTAAGTRTGAVTVNDSAASSPQTIALTGTGNALTLQSITVTPKSPALPVGSVQQFTATGNYTGGTTQDLTSSVMWTASENVVVVSLSSKGVATALAPGLVTIKAIVGTIVGVSFATVTAPALVSIAVTPANSSIAVGTTRQFTATGNYTDGSTANLTSTVTWSSSNSGAATINAAGLATSTSAPGTTTISASSGGISGSTLLTNGSATLASIAVTPNNSSIATGATEQFTATGTYTDGSTQNLTTQATWTSSSGATANVSNSPGSTGLATALGQGSTTITGTLGSVSGSTALNVTSAALVSIALTPSSITVPTGTQQQFTATGTYANSTTQDITATVAWSSSSPSIATISNGGVVAAIKQGTTTLTATLGTIGGSAQLTVGPSLGGFLSGLNSTEQRMVFLPITGGQALFTLLWKPAGDGFGPLYTQPGCAECHSTPVAGGAGSVQVTRFGTLNSDGSFNKLENEGGPVLHPNSVGAQPVGSLQHLAGCSLPPNAIPSDATIISLRQTPPVFGDGLIDAIADSTIVANQTFQAGDPVSQALGIHGVANLEPDLAGNLRPGRFGWKAQQVSLLGFSGEAELFELGISDPEFPNENQPQSGTIPPSCEVARSEPNDPTGVSNNLTVNFAAFAAFLAPPIPAAPTADTIAGQQTFVSIGCADCHMPSMQTQANFKLPRDFPVPLGSGATEPSVVLSNQTANLFSDLLIHDMGQGLNDSTPQGQASGSQWRTAPLWGLSHKVFLLHDGRCTGSNAIPCAITAHGGEANTVIGNYLVLTPAQQAEVLAFLSSL